ncbi:FG-GAP repeat protein [Edaphocola aurantiacus]|uniref:FG-GAP repeat protein n=1 Tax=Edaphocola aurantiacus TaxID=2601682 RepID=UPI001C9517BC|nr:hypothetical protein [Edaphocola aurantiacus]
MKKLFIILGISVLPTCIFAQIKSTTLTRDIGELHIEAVIPSIEMTEAHETPAGNIPAEVSSRQTGVVKLYVKGNNTPFLVHKSASIHIENDKGKLSLPLDGNIDFRDYNFDGHADIAIVGEPGGYNFYRYTVYLYNKSTDKFIKSKAIEEINNQVCCGINIDKGKKLIYTDDKDGYAWNQMKYYTFNTDNSLKLVKIKTYGISKTNKPFFTIESPVNGVMKKRNVTEEAFLND